MKPITAFLFVWAAASILACGKASLEQPAADAGPVDVEATGTVRISLGGPFTATRVTNPADETETQCQRWALWLFDQNGDSTAYGTSLSGEGISKTVLVGDYTAIALVNYPTSLDPADIRRKQDIANRVTSLSDNATGAFLMYGETTIRLEKDRTVSQTVDVKRLVAKVGIKKVSVAFESPYLAAKTTVLQAIYLTNLYRTSRMGADYTSAELSAASSAWYNVMGWHLGGSTNAATDALVGDLAIQATLTPSAPHTSAHYFYAYPNPTPEGADTHNAVWSIRSSRLVLQVAVGGKTYYYQIQIPAMGRNRKYIAEEIILKKLGSQDPEQDIPGAVDVVFSASGQDWDNDYNVTENT